MRASHGSREIFARVSHDVRANFDQFYLSQFSLEMVLIMSHICADRGNFLAMCLRTSGKGWRLRRVFQPYEYFNSHKKMETRKCWTIKLNMLGK